MIYVTANTYWTKEEILYLHIKRKKRKITYNKKKKKNLVCYVFGKHNFLLLECIEIGYWILSVYVVLFSSVFLYICCSIKCISQHICQQQANNIKKGNSFLAARMVPCYVANIFICIAKKCNIKNVFCNI